MGTTARTGAGHPHQPGPGPVIVLTMARSGSTLLRFILDSHPELACPPETSLGSACSMLARLWDLLEPSPESAGDSLRPQQVPANLPEAAAASVRGAVDEVYGRYLARRGKRRWCDKSLNNLEVAELLAEIYPDAQFVCLYRHCLDVIVSAVEACPWGLGGYGFEHYAAVSQGNSVIAVALSWLDRTRPIIEFQEKHPDRCLGIRYEDLVTEPEEVAAVLFDFLGVQRVPGITAACFAADHEVRGPGDHKIWFTERISRDSLGQGIRVPVALFPPEVLAKVNLTLAQLEYRLVDDDWATAAGPLDPRAGHEPAASPHDDPAVPDAEADAAAASLSARLSAAAAWPAAGLDARWPASACGQLALLVGPPGGTGPAAGWTVSREDGGLAIREGVTPDPAGSVIAAAGATWLALLTGQANMAAELRAGRLRVTGANADQPASMHAEVRVLAHLLGLAASLPSDLPQDPAPQAQMAMAAR